MTDFLTKPVDKVEFISRLKNMLALRRSHLSLASRARTLAEELRRVTADVYERERETIVRLARAAEFRDPETGAHIVRMANSSIEPGRHSLRDAHGVVDKFPDAVSATR